MEKVNPFQIDALEHPARFKFILAGRRGGKTVLIREDQLETIHTAPRNAEIAYIGPTNTQAKELMWEPLEQRMYELGWQFAAKISKSRFELSRGRKIYVIGAEKISRIRGHKLLKAYLDELAYFEQPFNRIWSAVRPALSDYRGGAIISTTPDGKGSQAYDVFMAAKEKENWETFSWRTIDNPWIDPEEIEEARRELDERAFKQEYEALWQSYEGLAYYNFDEILHVKKQSAVNVSQPLYLCFDFNVNPTTLLLSQFDGNKLRFISEYSQRNGSTEDTVREFCEAFADRKRSLNLKIRGDASGKARTSATGKSDYFYVHEMLQANGFTYQQEVPAKNPPIIDRLKYANGWLKPMKGEPKIEIDPSCKELIRDLSSQGLNGRVPSDKNNLGHKADAFGYCIYWQQMKGLRKPQATIQL
jgi:hypothetical protein